MKASDAAALYVRAGLVPPPELATPSGFEKIVNTKRKTIDGREFRSALEADAYQLLKVWQRAGHISDLELQPRFLLQASFQRHLVTIRGMHYTADFRFVRDGRTVIVEAKGFRTQAFNLRRKLFLRKFPDLDYEIWDRKRVYAG